MRQLIAVVLLLLGGCSALNGGIAESHEPWRIECKGKVSLAVIGSAAAFAGVNGSVVADCGTDGAYISRVNPQ